MDEVSRAKAIFKASENLKPFDPADFDLADFDFAVEEEAEFEASPPAASSSPVTPAPAPRPGQKRILGMTPVQLAILIGLALLLLLIAAGFVYYILVLA